MSEKEYNDCLKEIQEENATKEKIAKLREEKRKYSYKFKLPSTSKIVLAVVFVLCIEIIIFSEYVMITLGDTSAMYTLIGVPVTLVPTLLGYYHKSCKENTSGGIIYEKAMHECNQDIEDDGEDSDDVNPLG